MPPNYCILKNNTYLCTRNRERLQDKSYGSVVQLVRIHACHAWGRGFESRPDRQKQKSLVYCESKTFLF